MDRLTKKYKTDYRVNSLSNGVIISVEVTCCNRHIGEMHYKDGESRKCPLCGMVHQLIVQHNHFHIRPIAAAADEAGMPEGSS